MIPESAVYSDPTYSKQTILVVEDEEMLCSVVKMYLEEEGYIVLAVSNGEDAEEVYAQHPEIALVLSDIGLPGITGDNLFVILRKINPIAKIILSTGFIDAASKSNLLRAGVKHIVQKPYVPGDLLKQIRLAMDS
ncbi:MAG: response regulator [bacterium]